MKEPVRLTDNQNFLTELDMDELVGFNESLHRDQVYKTDKMIIDRLVELGVLRSLGKDKVGITSFGTWLIEKAFDQSASLPLKTTEDQNNEEHQRHLFMTQLG